MHKTVSGPGKTLSITTAKMAILKGREENGLVRPLVTLGGQVTPGVGLNSYDGVNRRPLQLG